VYLHKIILRYERAKENENGGGCSKRRGEKECSENVVEYINGNDQLEDL
jgi:hypothetical protein